MEELSPELLAILENDDEGLLDEPAKPLRLTAESRLERAFLEIVNFYVENGRTPDPDTLNIAERKLGARLVGIRANDEKREALVHLDAVGLLKPATVPNSVEDLLEESLLDDPLLSGSADVLDTSSLPKNTRNSAESVAKRERAKDFQQFEPLFKQKHEELSAGAVTLSQFKGENTIEVGRFYLLKGALAFVAEIHEPKKDAPKDSKGNPKGRLRVIFENGTESRMYQQSFAVRLYEEGGQALVRTSIDASEIDGEDIESGYIYVLRSLSQDPEIKDLRDLYKIGFTTTTVEKRIEGAEKSPTYLNAPVEVVATYKLYNVRASKVEAYLHKVFAPFRLDITVSSSTDPGDPGSSVHVNEWFIAPLPQIDEAITKLSGAIATAPTQ